MGKHEKNEKKWDFEKFWGKKLIRKPNQRRSRHPQVCFHFQIKKTCLFQYLFFSDRSFSGCVFPDYFLFRRCLSDYILFKPCLVILCPFQHVPLLTISSSEKTESRTFFSSASLTWIYETTGIKRKKHMRHPDIKIYETLVGTVFQQVS